MLKSPLGHLHPNFRKKGTFDLNLKCSTAGERPCHYRHTHIASGCRIARTDLRPATSVSERGASGSVSSEK